jgi:hypothetical protein
VINVGGDWWAQDKLNLNGSYTRMKCSGVVASGIVYTQLQDATGSTDLVIDNTLYTLSLGAACQSVAA